MSAGLAVFWQVSFLNRFCWIWSSGVVINTLKFSWMKRTCDVSKLFSQIESLQVDIKSLNYQKESFCSIIHYGYNSPTFHVCCRQERCHTIWSGGNAVDLGSWTFSDRFPPDTYTFWTRFSNIIILEMWSFDNKKSKVPSATLRRSTSSLRVEPTTFEVQGGSGCHFGTGVLFCRIPMVKFRYI